MADPNLLSQLLVWYCSLSQLYNYSVLVLGGKTSSSFDPYYSLYYSLNTVHKYEYS